MRAVNAYKNTKKFSYGNDFDILVGKLSLVRNKQLGLTTVLYTTLQDAEELRAYDILRLYDEIYYLSDERFTRINGETFWASIKFFALEAEMNRLGNEPFFLQDQDLVGCGDDISLVMNQPLVFGFDKEKLEHYENDLPLPANGQYPDYYNFNIIPYTTAIIKIDNKQLLQTYLDLVFSFILNNPLSSRSSMITAEQRFMANVVNYYQEKPAFVLKKYKAEFQLHHFHVGGLKYHFTARPQGKYRGIKSILMLFQRYSMEEYQKALAVAHEDVKYVLDNGDFVKIAPQFKNYFSEDK